MKNTQQHKHLFIYVNSAIIVFAAILFGYWYFIDGVVNPVITFQSDPLMIATDKSVYHRGDVIYISFSYCKNRLIPASVSWRLVDGQIILFSPVEKSIAIGCYGTQLLSSANSSVKPYFTGTVEIPMNIEPGIWHLEGEVTYVVNPIKTQTSKRKTVEFEIIP